MNDGYMGAAAVPVPDQMADALQSALPLATFLAPNKLPLDARDVAQMQAHRLRGQGYRLVPVPDAGDDTRNISKEEADFNRAAQEAAKQYGLNLDEAKRSLLRLGDAVVGDDALREQLFDALVMSPLSDTAGTDLAPFRRTADALLPRIRTHVAAAVQAERERVSALLASIPDEYYPTDVFGGPLSTDESRQANKLLKAEGLPTFDRVGANAMRHAYRNAARIALEEPDDDE